MMATTWTFKIDWNKDGDFDDSNEDVSARVLQASWFLGFREPYQDVADNSVLTLVVRNNDRLFSPENSSGALYGLLLPFRAVRVESFDGTTTRIHWVGRIESIQPMVSANGQRTAQIVAAGVMHLYKAAETQLALQENKRTDEIIAELIKEVVIPPAGNQAWILGVEGSSNAGQSTYMSDVTTYSVLEQGKTSFTLTGDNWVRQGGFADAEKDTFDVYHAIADVVGAERGRFFLNREGKAIFWNRHHLLYDVAPTVTFSDDMMGMTYTYAGVNSLKNEVIVVCHPRTVSASSTEILWQLQDDVIVVEPGQTRKVYVKFQDEKASRIGGKDVTLTDVTFAYGSASYTINAKANGAELVFTNDGNGEPAVVQTAIVRGKKITTYNRIEAKAQDQTSMSFYGRRTMRLNLPGLSALEQAQYVADFELLRRKQPRGEVSSLALVSHGKSGGEYHAQQLALTIGSSIAISESQTGHNRRYFIIGEAHELAQGATLWKTTWHLESAPDPVIVGGTNINPFPWELNATDHSKLGESTYLTY
ncbi:MAG: hypothetical protein L6Q98_21290 [Anaerolineae bacterium]|nr:hypothetical protein [Anaerolineae bacterium]NUQ06123.1 hypothetical protein [Anaerolineae bacterium]